MRWRRRLWGPRRRSGETWRPLTSTRPAETGFSESVPVKRLATVEEVASAYVHLMTNGFITGQVLTVDGGVMLRK
jgi:NAD(P)-dependent dehydrogenase (short-subunit alcohol dehydrogenase family)